MLPSAAVSLRLRSNKVPEGEGCSGSPRRFLTRYARAQCLHVTFLEVGEDARLIDDPGCYETLAYVSIAH